MYKILQVAKYEMRLLFRSWGVRVFAILGLILIAVLAIGIGTPLVRKPYFFFALPGSLALNSIKLFNVFQGIIAAFLATEFFKRDRRHDTNEVVFVRSFSNLQYLTGKVLGIFGVFFLLNLGIMVITCIVHLFFSGSVFAVMPYLVYPLLYSMPTVFFIVGLAVFLVHLIRSQAVVFIIILAYSFFVLVFAGSGQFGIWDSYGFYQPLVYSDFIGFGNLGEFLQVRFVYMFAGIAFFCGAVLLNRRLRQAAAPNLLTGIIGIICLLGAVFLGTGYVSGKQGDLDYRASLKKLSTHNYSHKSPMVTSYHIDLRQKGESIFVTAALELKNDSPEPLSSFLFTLNPGLSVSEVKGNRGTFSFKREAHLLYVSPSSPLPANGEVQISIVYAGKIDERYCYLDIPGTQLEDAYRLWVYGIPKRYAFVNSHYLLLTPESGWYPVPGLAPGAAFPSPYKRNFSKYSLTVTVPKGMHAISQGEPIPSAADGNVVTFKPETPLSQLSLTVGRYEKREVKVENVTYALYTLPGHDYFVPYFKDVKDFPKLIKQLRADYEVMLGLRYPYGRLSLVEVPIPFYSYRRAWTAAPETVQPQVVFLPEMGATLSGTDFEFFSRMMRQRFGRQDTSRSPEEMQGGLFNRFIRMNFLETREDMSRMFLGDTVSDAMQSNVEARFEFFPNMVTYVNHISSESEGAGPLLNVALESFMQGQVFSPRSMFRRLFGGLTEAEETNLLLNGRSIKDLTKIQAERDIRTETILEALNQKGKHLFALLETTLAEKGVADFQVKFKAFLSDHRFKTITEKEFNDFILSLGNIDLNGILDSWANEAQLPGYTMENFEAYQVLADAADTAVSGVKGDGQVKTQIKFRLTNPTKVNGLVKIAFMSRSRRGFGRGGISEDFSKYIRVPAESTKDIAVLLEQQPFFMTMDTFVSRNIPAVEVKNFRGLKLKRDEKPVEYEQSIEFKRPDQGENGVYIVDNEDSGFEILSKAKESWLKRTVQSIFGGTVKKSLYDRYNVVNPPGNWTPTAFQEFFGTFIQSGVYKKSGNGQSKVAWNVTLKEPGDYDIFFYYEGENRMLRFMRRGRRGPGGGPGGGPGRQADNPPPSNEAAGKKHFVVHHEDGVEEVVFDLKDAQQGWNLLGTFRLVSGQNRIELTDKNELGFVSADAVKFVKRN